jgi:putative transposase
LSITQACQALTLGKFTYYYEKKLKDDSEIIEELNILVEKHPRNGFWLLLIV